MRKQAGRIYCRDVSKSPETPIEPIERLQHEDLRTIRRDPRVTHNLVSESRQAKRL